MSEIIAFSTRTVQSFSVPQTKRLMIVRVLSRSLFLLSMACSLAATSSVFAQSTVVQRNYPGLTLSGTAGTTYPIQYVGALSNVNNWTTLTNITLPAGPYVWIDASAGDVSARFYRKTNVVASAR